MEATEELEQINSPDMDAGEAAEETSYDKIPYTVSTFPQLDPALSGAFGRIFGLSPAPPDACRVLELGCGHGLSMVALAQKYPGSEFVGIDLSKKQIANGRSIAEGAGIGNVRLEAWSITDERVLELGEFDYIACHGVYSWVPPEVQQRILEINGTQLSDNGIAYVSYNTFPGWKGRQAFRDMALDFAGRCDKPLDKVKLASIFFKAMARFTEKSANRSDRVLIQSMAKVFSQGRPNYLLHEYMEECNAPCYFREFIDRASEAGLQFLAEQNLPRNFPKTAMAKVAPLLLKMARDKTDLQQLCDYMLNTQFRSTLLAKKSITLQQPQFLDAMAGLAFKTSLRPPADLSLAHGLEQEFRAGKQTVKLSGARIKALMAELAEAPEPVEWNKLIECLEQRLQNSEIRLPATPADQDIKKNLLQFVARQALSGHVGISLESANRLRGARSLPERPVATRLARHQAANNQPPTNLVMETRPVLPYTMRALPLCDGRHTTEEIVAQLVSLVESGTLEPPKIGKEKRVVTDKKEMTRLFHGHMRHLWERKFFLDETSASQHAA